MKSLVLFILLFLFSFSGYAERMDLWSCEQLIKKSQDKNFILNVLAGLRAHKKCSNFKYSWRDISDFDKKIYSDELLMIDPDAKAPMNERPLKDLQAGLKKENDPKEKMKIYKTIRQKYRNAGQLDKSQKMALEIYTWARKSWLKNTKDNVAANLYLEAGQIYAKSLWNSKKEKKAFEIINTVISNLKKRILTADLYLLSGRIYADQKDDTKALKNFTLAIDEASKKEFQPNNFDITKVKWIKAWMLYQDQKWSEASTAFADIVSTTTDNSEKSRSRFFQAKCLKKLEQPEEAKTLLKLNAEADFFNYYSLVSYYELGQKLPALDDMKGSTNLVYDTKLSFLTSAQKDLFYELINFEEFEIAEAFVTAVKSQERNFQDELSLNMVLAEKAHRYLPLFSTFGKMSSNDKIYFLTHFGDLIYPRPYNDSVMRMSEKTGLPWSLIFSIMRQESAFDEKTHSHADAMGLMQVIPNLAKSISKKFKIPYKNEDDLMNPDINIQIGSYELKQQVDKQGGQLSLMAAAYNAGPTILKRWLKDKKPTQDIYDFIENIPFDETKTYVKIIARNQLFYERLAKPHKQIDFPKDFLKEF